MKVIVSLLITLVTCHAQADVESEYYEALEKIEANYRVGKAELIKKADKVVVYLVDFDGITKDDFFANHDKGILIAPYRARTKILKTKELAVNDRKQLLSTLSKAIARPRHTGGADCHYPIHGVRIYAGNTVLHEGTFCWVCGNFAFAYPQGSEWLDTNAELKRLFTRLMPIPQAELNRFYRKYPGAKPKAQQSRVPNPEPEPESNPNE